MKTAMVAVWIFFAFVPVVEANDCEKKGGQWVYNYPERHQKGQIMAITHDSLGDAQNIRPQFTEWWGQMRPSLIYTFAGQQIEHAARLVVYKLPDGSACVDVEAAQAKQDRSVPRGQGFRGTKSRGPSLGKRILSFVLRSAPNFGITALTWGTGAVPMAVAGISSIAMSSDLLSGGGGHSDFAYSGTSQGADMPQPRNSMLSVLGDESDLRCTGAHCIVR